MLRSQRPKTKGRWREKTKRKNWGTESLQRTEECLSSKMEAKITRQNRPSVGRKSLSLKLSIQGESCLLKMEPKIDIYMQTKPENIYHQKTSCKRTRFKEEKETNQTLTRQLGCKTERWINTMVNMKVNTPCIKSRLHPIHGFEKANWTETV